MTCKFWWGNSPDNRKIHWVNWKQICKNKKQGGLGFRSIRDFNEALLAKQAWQCITKPDTLLSKVLKAKYFPKSDILHVKPSQNMSYTWNSILKASWILKKGGLWKIGNGENINIWHDNWLPEQPGHKIWSVASTVAPQKLVKDLILPISKNWNTSLVKHLFLPFEATQILNIPIINTNYPDEFYWPNTKDGVYTVKSGYHTLQDWKGKSSDPSTSNPIDSNPIWENIWQQQIPPKMNQPMWRINQNALPVRSNLIARGIHCNPLCPRCNAKIEDSNHVFRDCEWVKQVWFASQLTINFNKQDNKSFVDWVQDMFAQNQTKNNCTNLISSLCYHIWKARNMLIFQQKDIPVMVVVNKASQDLLEYTKQMEKGSTRHGANNLPRSNEIKWSPPPSIALKINVDAHCKGDGRWGLGWVVRNGDRICLGAAIQIVQARNVLEAEAKGLEEVLRSIHRFSDHNIIVELDSSTVVNAIQKKDYPRVYWGSIARNGGDLLCNLPNVSVCWGRRTGNKVAHLLARWTFNQPNSGWLTSVPPILFLISLLIWAFAK
ncbi:putative mitochondrial protein [Trifolium repens]|nr:putative mitochondrial protein [Trifolium repens]